MNAGTVRQRSVVRFVCDSCRHDWRDHSHRGRRGNSATVSMKCGRRGCPCEIFLPTRRNEYVVEEELVATTDTRNAHWQFLRLVT